MKVRKSVEFFNGILEKKNKGQV